MLGGMGNISKSAKELAKMAREKSGSGSRKPRRRAPKKFDAMTEGRKVSKAKKELEAKKKRQEMDRRRRKALQELRDLGSYSPDPKGTGKAIPKVRPKTKVTGPMRAGKMYGGEMKKKKGMMGGGKMYASMNKRYANGGKVYPRKGNV